MSHVTDIILVAASGATLDEFAPLVYYLQEQSGSLGNLANMAGGPKALQCELYVGAFDHINIAKLKVSFYNCMPENQECVQLFVKDEHEDQFNVYRLVEPHNFNLQE